MDVCILNGGGEILLHRQMKAAPAPFLKAVAPYREDLVVGVEGIFTWYWLADLGAQEDMSFVLGHALSMKAIHGGQATNAQIDAHTMAVLRRGGRLPQASGYPAAMRAPRDLLRRRRHLMRQRAERLAHRQQTHSQAHLSEIGKQLADKANRAGVAERCPDPAVQKRLEVDLALMGHDDRLRMDLALSMVHTAKADDAHPVYRLRSIPEVGKLLALVLRYEIHDIQRFPRVQEFVSSCCLVKWAQESAGKRDGTSGTKSGHAYRTWAFSEAAGLVLRKHPAGQNYLARLERRHAKGNALTVLAPQLARAV
jgi:transposase